MKSKVIDTIHIGDALESARLIPSGMVNCIVTSPPYFGLRDYGVQGQIGLEDTPEQYIDKLVELFRELKRLLADDGTLWVNIGDSYAGGGNARGQNSPMSNKQASNTGATGQCSMHQKNINPELFGCKPKDLIGIPWMLAFALRSDGWFLRSDIIWYKRNSMPESVKDRPAKAHEYIFLFSKKQRYYFDHESIQEDAISNPNKKGHICGGVKRMNYINEHDKYDPMYRQNTTREYEYNGKSNKRSVWDVPVKPFKESHFATFPEDLIVPCIKAGCPEDGIVLDPFIGSGTTAVVAKKLNRHFIGFELNPEYVLIAEKRLHNEIGLFQ